MKSLFKVVSQTDPVTINTQNGTTQKTTIVLQEFGGKYENIVWASLRFSAREYNGSSYQDITIQDIVSFTQH